MTPLHLVHSAAPTQPARPSARPPLHAVKQSLCPCRDLTCRAQTLWAQNDPNYVMMGLRCFNRVNAKPGDVLQHEDGKWHERTSTGGWLLVDDVTVTGVDLDSGMIGDIRYLVRIVGAEIVVSPLPGQPITKQDAEHYQDAARAQWELERSL